MELSFGAFLMGRTMAYARNGKSESLEFDKLLIAAGAYDRPVPFPGWTLPGVLTAGGAQKLVKSERILPGEKILLAGTGPLQWVLAYQLIQAGGNVSAILEVGDYKKNWLKIINGMWGNLGLYGRWLEIFKPYSKSRYPRAAQSHHYRSPRRWSCARGGHSNS